MEDNNIIRRVKDGDTEAFADLVEKYHRRLLSFIYRITGCPDSVEDIGQEVFLGIYKSLKNFDETRGTPFSAWLFISARNRCITELRSSEHRSVTGLEGIAGIADDRGDIENIMLENERRQAIEYSLEQLPEPFRTTILRSLEGDSLEEIALKDGVPVGTVKSRLHRAREKIRKTARYYLGGDDYEGI